MNIIKKRNLKTNVNMKNQIKFLKLIVLFFVISNFYSCQNDDVTEESFNQELSIKTSRISLNQVISEVNNPEIKENLIEIKQKNSLLRNSESDVLFIKKEKENFLTTYILNINSYSQQKPYFLKFIITKNLNEEEKIGYIKYIPTNPITDLDLNTFTGEVQILNNFLEINGASNYINGIIQESNSNSTNRECSTEIVVTEIKCSHSGVHGVGQSCSPGYVNDAYFLVTIFTSCSGKGNQMTQVIEDTSSGNQNGSSYFPATIFLNPFLNTLTQDEITIFYSDPSIQEYLVNNLISVPNPNYNPLIGGDSTIIIIKPEAKQFVNWIFEFESLPNIPCGINHDCVVSILKMAEGLRAFHGEEGELMAEYLESLVDDYSSFTVGDLQIFYDTAKAITKVYNNRMLIAITGAFVEGLTPILEIALFETGTGVAVKLLQKIPISWVLRGTRLNNMVLKTAKLGVPGQQDFVRELHGTNVTKANELFLSLTKNAVSSTTNSNGIIVANMGNGSFITFRTVSSPLSPNVIATIDLNFPALFTEIIKLKFYQ